MIVTARDRSRYPAIYLHRLLELRKEDSDQCNSEQGFHMELVPAHGIDESQQGPVK